MLSVYDVCSQLKITRRTLYIWYEWAALEENKEIEHPELPKYEVYGSYKQRMWKEEDIEKLKIFQSWIPHGRNGFMASVSYKYVRGKNYAKK